jgi:sulfite exporter TauE/SafE
MPVDLLTLTAALLTGLLGGVHCVAMCAGIATGLAGSGPPRLGNALALNGGRVLGYVVAGALVGAFGGALLGIVRIDGLATTLRIGLGVLLVLIAARLWWPRQMAWMARAGGGVWSALAPLRSRLVPAAGPLRPWLLGLFWGWLPCGLSTAVLAAAWLEADAWHGALLMLAFGLGTLATMVPVTWAGARLHGTLATRGGRGAAAVFIAGSGLVTIAAPLLAQQPQVHALLAALGCRSL